MNLLTFKKLPPGGWILPQKFADGTTRKLEFMGPFADAIRDIRQLRLENNILPNDVDSIASELEQYTVQRLGGDPKWCTSQKKTLWQNVHALPSHVRDLAKHAVAAGRGATILSDWLGDGMQPVENRLAENRARVCLSCPLNVESHGASKWTDKIAAAILDQRRAKTERGLKVPHEELLFTCQECLCHLPLKVWVPLETILGRTDQIALDKFPDHCWMRTESAPKETPWKTKSKDGEAPFHEETSSLTPKVSTDSPSISEPPASPILEPDLQCTSALNPLEASSPESNVSPQTKSETSLPSIPTVNES